MAQITIELDVNKRERLANLAAGAGYDGVAEFVGSLVDRELSDPAVDAIGAPPHLTFRSDAELDQLLLARLEHPGPSVEVTPAFWADIRPRAGLPPKSQDQP